MSVLFDFQWQQRYEQGKYNVLLSEKYRCTRHFILLTHLQVYIYLT